MSSAPAEFRDDSDADGDNSRRSRSQGGSSEHTDAFDDMYELEEEEEEEEVDESEFPLSELLESNGFDQFFGTEQDK